MNLEPEATSRIKRPNSEFVETLNQKPLVLLRDTEALLRCKMVKTVAPILPPALAIGLGEASVVAEESLNQLAEIDLDAIGDLELQPARILVGLSFVGFGALGIVLLLLYLYTLHPELNTVQQIGKYWYQYIWVVCLGVAGMFILGREAMRD